MSPKWWYIARSPGFLIPGLWPKRGTPLSALVLGVWPTALHFLYIQEAPLLAFLPDATPTPNTQHLKQRWAAWAHQCWLNYLQLAECLTSSNTKGPAGRAGGWLHHSAAVSTQPSAGQAISTKPEYLPPHPAQGDWAGTLSKVVCPGLLCFLHMQLKAALPKSFTFFPPPLWFLNMHMTSIRDRCEDQLIPSQGLVPV